MQNKLKICFRQPSGNPSVLSRLRAAAPRPDSSPLPIWKILSPPLVNVQYNMTSCNLLQLNPKHVSSGKLTFRLVQHRATYDKPMTSGGLAAYVQLSRPFGGRNPIFEEGSLSFWRQTVNHVYFARAYPTGTPTRCLHNLLV